LLLPPDLGTAVLGGKYRVIGPIATADGVVQDGVARLHAEHASIQREVEVKILVQPSEAGRAKLFREARALGQVSHPSMRSVLDSGVDDKQRPFVVYEALPGETLAHRLARFPHGMDPEAAATIAMQILEALRALHRTDTVARALSPESIVLVETKSGEVAKIASLERAALNRDATLEPVRFNPWAAPEVRRSGSAPGPEADVYSAGMMLRHLLTGRPTEGGVLPDTAARAIERATAEDPEERFPSVEVLMSCVALMLPTSERPARDEMVIPLDPLAADIQWLALRRRTRHGTLAEGPNEEERVHLMSALVAIESVYRRLGEHAWARLVEAVPAVEELLPGAGNTSAHLRTGVPMALLGEILERADGLAGNHDLTIVSELGASIAQRSLRRLCPDLPAHLTPGTLIDGFPYLWSRIARDGEGVVLDRTSGEAKLAIDGCVPPLELVGLTAAILRTALVEAGGRPVSVTILACSALGDRRTVLLARWVPRASIPPRA
jgi:hypothetical protein